MTAPPIAERAGELDRILDEMGSVVVGFSGGVDSALLAVRAHQRLGARALAVTADSASLPERQRTLAANLARTYGFAHRMVETDEFANPAYVQNAPDRCFHCKTELFTHLRAIASAEGFRTVAYGLIADDLADFRPGHRAARAAGARGPLAEAGFGKPDVRELSRAMGLPTWDLPASPCLSSRVPYGTPVLPPVLSRIERAEEAVRALGFRELRVRHLGDKARVEIAAGELGRVLDDAALRQAIEAAVRGAGYAEVDVDPEGYRRGRLNEGLPG